MSLRSVGVMLGVSGAAGGEQVRARAHVAEEAGLDSVFVGDPHGLGAAQPGKRRHPGHRGRRDRPSPGRVRRDSAAAAPPAWLARQVATLQLLSGDRVILGVGTGGEVHGRAGWGAAGVPWTQVLDTMESPVRGARGATEFFALAQARRLAQASETVR